MSGICRIASCLLLTSLFVAGCGTDLSLSFADVNGTGVPPLPVDYTRAPSFPGPPLPLGAQTILFAQPSPQFNSLTPVFIPGIGVVYVGP
jgi:hypothetical protein